MGTSLQHFLKSVGVGIVVALNILLVGVAGQVAWLALGLPGVHRTAGQPVSVKLAGIHNRSGVQPPRE